MKELIIIGAGGFGREVLQYAIDMKNASEDIQWKIGGFLDDNLQALENLEYEYNVLDSITNHEVKEDYVYICAIGDPTIKMKVCNEYLSKGAKFINIIHPTAQIGRTCKYGVGNVFCPLSIVTTDVTIGDFIFFNLHVSCGHDSVVGSGCTISPYCHLAGHAKLEENVFLGRNAVICPGLTIGSNTKIGAGATVINDIPSNCTAVGVPAKVVKLNDIED